MTHIAQGKYWSGTSGLVLPVPNKKAFPPAFRDKSRLTYYSSLFNSIEVNSSFYKVPQAATVGKWAASVPENFVFTFKLWRDITHAKGFVYDPQQVLRFMEVIRPAGTKKGCLLIQFPPSLTIDKYGQVEELLELLQDIDPAHGWKVALEFRHPSWYIGEVYELADEHASSIVLHDIPKSRNVRLNKHAPFVYLRFHGLAGDYKGGYTNSHLQEQAKQIQTWMQEGKEVYVYFNNTIGDAIPNLMTLNGFVAEL
ncbi:Uncharacterized conserved protein YecE, DUF72 family [Chitinophaga rupis]|uniref:Uncharacterized conserved protein YecE, DUF72 family n=1 Tax=Chitinophaga rupis TaxID=573321 RepID=A0A1H7T3C9_9BACT|nr:DUF72 domain-containing protein [Chitinophaga rupis]SEL79323.1 Uncharacterized conserved protein YecE, DUF72 family [Chitinophaga rupis]